MGCDIHAHAEIKIKGKWEHYDQPRFSRWYALFEKMAGVRGEVSNAIAAPRGLPHDATATTYFDSAWWGEDGHSHSWLSAAEILKLAEWHEREFPEHGKTFDRRWDQWLFGNTYSDFMRHPNDRPAGLEDVRFVFWFDN